VFCYTSWRFYEFFGTNLLTRCHRASSYFLLFLCFRKVTQEIFSELDEIKPNITIFNEASRRTTRRRRGARGQPHHQVARPSPWPRRLVVRGPWSTSDAAPSPIKTPRQEKPKQPDQFSRNISRSAAVVDLRSGESRSSSWHPAGEGNHHRRSSSSPCLPPA
jgi:hypothetical protein